MNDFLKKLLVYGFVFLLVSNLIAFASLYFLGKSSFYKSQFLENEVKEKTFDYIVLGSSTGLTTLNTNIIDSVAGTKGINLSIDDTALNSHYLMLEHFYSLGKKTKYCILDVNYWNLQDAHPTLNDNDYRFVTHILKDYTYDYYNDLETNKVKVLAWSRYFPLLAIGYYNTELFYPSLLTIVKPRKKNRFDNKGNYTYPSRGKKMKLIEKKEMQVSIQNPYFNRIVELCKKNNTYLILHQSPIIDKKVFLEDSNNYKYINHSILELSEDSYYDKIHVTQKGNSICSISLGNQLKLIYPTN